MNDLPARLDDFGLTQYETATYLALLNGKRLSAPEISEISGIPKGRVYGVLKGLVDKGFCTMFAGSPRRFQAVNPAFVVKDLVSEQKRELASRVARMESSAERLSAAFEDHVDISIPMDYFQVLTSGRSVVHRYFELSRNASRSLLTFNKPPYVNIRDLDHPESQIKSFFDVLADGVEVRGIYEIEADNLESFVPWVRAWIDAGESVRLAERLPVKFCITDEQVAMLTLHNKGKSKNPFTSIVVEHPDVIHSLGELFEWYWSQSMTLDQFLETLG